MRSQVRAAGACLKADPGCILAGRQASGWLCCWQALHALGVTDARLLASEADAGRVLLTLAPYLKGHDDAGSDDAARRRGAEQLLCVLYIQARPCPLLQPPTGAIARPCTQVLQLNPQLPPDAHPRLARPMSWAAEV